MKILGIHRGTRFSPNHIANDEAIFRLTARNLEAHGARVELIPETEFLQRDMTGPYIFTMAREKQVVARLKSLGLSGSKVINSGEGIEKCYRVNMTRLLLSHGVPHPESVIVPTRGKGLYEALESLGNQGLWVKRGDFHALHKEDVVYVPDRAQAVEMLEEFARRDIAEVVVSRHLKGDLVKFYAVRGTDFFYWFYPYDHQHIKYPEAQQVEKKEIHHAFSIDQLRSEANRAAGLLDVDVYGGDAIVGEDGGFHLIDFNDWPSFAPCRTEAAPFIAQRILDRCKAESPISNTFI